MFNFRTPDAHRQALTLNDTDPFMNIMHGTANYFGPDGERHCLFPNSPKGFGDLANDKHACKSTTNVLMMYFLIREKQSYSVPLPAASQLTYIPL